MAKKKRTGKLRGCLNGCAGIFVLVIIVGALLPFAEGNRSARDVARQPTRIATIQQARIQPTTAPTEQEPSPQPTHTLIPTIEQIGAAPVTTVVSAEPVQFVAQVASATPNPPTATSTATSTLTRTPPPTSTKTPEPKLLYVYSNQNINGRAEPSTTAAILTSIPPGTAVEKISEADGTAVSGSTLWYEVSYDGQIVFVHSSLLRDTDGPLPPPVQQNAPPTSAPAQPAQQQPPPAQPTAVPQQPAQPIEPPPQSTIPPAPPAPAFQCNCSKTCPAMASCEEAYFQLNTCGCGRRDGDNDGVPCEDLCPGG